jgi:hypothetical protein
MFKRWASFILLLAMLFSFATVFADVQQAPEIRNITITEAGGKFKLHNVEMMFRKDFMGKDMEPITFTVALYTENGVPYIDIEPSVEKFSKEVTISVKKGEITMYDIATGKNVNVKLENYRFNVKHFSRYIIID